MTTYIFIWDGATNYQPQIAEAARLLSAGMEVKDFDWSTGKRENFDLDSNFLLYRTRKEPRGIIGYGTIVNNSLRWREHWKKEGEDCCYVDMSPQRLIDPVVHPELVLTSAVMRRAGITRYEGMNRIQVSGCSIEEHDADLIRKLFDRQFSDRQKLSGR